MTVLVVIFASMMAAVMYACCKVAGDADRQAETSWIQKEDGEEEYPPVWNEDDKHYSGLLEEDDP